MCWPIDCAAHARQIGAIHAKLITKPMASPSKPKKVVYYFQTMAILRWYLVLVICSLSALSTFERGD